MNIEIVRKYARKHKCYYEGLDQPLVGFSMTPSLYTLEGPDESLVYLVRGFKLVEQLITMWKDVSPNLRELYASTDSGPLLYGLGSWCQTVKVGDTKLMLVVLSPKLWEREQNQGTY